MSRVCLRSPSNTSFQKQTKQFADSTGSGKTLLLSWIRKSLRNQDEVEIGSRNWPTKWDPTGCKRSCGAPINDLINW